MNPDRLLNELAREVLADKRKHRWQTTLLSVLCSVIIASAMGIVVTLWVSSEAKKDARARAELICQMQRESRTEGNRRIIYIMAVKEIVEHFPATREFLRKERPDLYPLPTINYLEVPNCEKQLNAAENLASTADGPPVTLDE